MNTENTTVQEIRKLIRETQDNLKEMSAFQQTVQKERDMLIKKAAIEMEELRATTKETSRIVAETSKQIKETDEQMKKTDEQMKRTDEQIKETNEQMKRTDEQMKRTDEQMKRTDKKINKYIGNTGNYWGNLGENLIKGNLAKRLKERGIEVEKVVTNAKYGGIEFDIIAINGKEVVVVEVKATLEPSDIENFKQNMKQFKSLWSIFKNKTVYGALAYLLKSKKKSEILAEKEGFFVISATGDVLVQNTKGFKPKSF